MAEQRRLLPRRRSVAQNHLLALLTRQLDDLVPGEWRALDVVDLGGGTGGMAIPLAARGHQVRVVDPSPDALAALERRTADAGLTGRIAGLQGDAAELASLIGERQADVVVCHRVLEVVDDPAAALGRHGRHAPDRRGAQPAGGPAAGAGPLPGARRPPRSWPAGPTPIRTGSTRRGYWSWSSAPGSRCSPATASGRSPTWCRNGCWRPSPARTRTSPSWRPRSAPIRPSGRWPRTCTSSPRRNRSR